MHVSFAVFATTRLWFMLPQATVVEFNDDLS
jgi:hypothetical protein